MTGSEPIWLDPLVNFCAVLLGASLAWGTSYFFERKRQRAENLALAYSLIFKVQELSDRILKLSQHIEECRTVAVANGMHEPNWQVITEVIGYREPLEPITASELALVAKTKDTELAMKIRELESGHAISFETFDHIIGSKKQLASAGLTTQIQGEVATMEATQEQFAQIAHIVIAMESSSRSLFEMMPRVAQEAREISETLGPKLKSEYNFDHFVSLSLADKVSAEQDSDSKS